MRMGLKLSRPRNQLTGCKRGCFLNYNERGIFEARANPYA